MAYGYHGAAPTPAPTPSGFDSSLDTLHDNSIEFAKDKSRKDGLIMIIYEHTFYYVAQGIEHELIGAGLQVWMDHTGK